MPINNGCDDVIYEMKLLLPVTLRLYAATKTAALEQFRDCEVQITGPQQSFSVGFPKELTLKEVETATELRT